MPGLTAFDPALAELLLSLALTVGLLASAALTIGALPWTDREIAQVDQTARALASAPARRVAAFSRQAFARSSVR